MYELLRRVPLVAGLPDTDLEHLRQVVGECGYPQGRSRLRRIVPASRRLSLKEGRGQ